MHQRCARLANAKLTCRPVAFTIFDQAASGQVERFVGRAFCAWRTQRTKLCARPQTNYVLGAEPSTPAARLSCSGSRLPKPGVLQKPNQNLNKSMRARPTTKLNRRWKPERREERAQAVDGRVQRFVVLQLGRFNHGFGAAALL